MTGLSDETAAGLSELAFFEILRQRLQKEILVAQPAAQADWTQAVPAGVAWELLNVKALLTTDANVANRVATVRINDAAAIQVARFQDAAAQVAGVASIHEWGAGMGLTGSANGFAAGLPSPPFLMPEGWTIRSDTLALQAADQWSAVVLIVREWSIREVLLNVEWIKNHAR